VSDNPRKKAPIKKVGMPGKQTSLDRVEPRPGRDSNSAQTQGHLADMRRYQGSNAQQADIAAAKRRKERSQSTEGNRAEAAKREKTWNDSGFGKTQNHYDADRKRIDREMRNQWR
jgi:hypothetical protein